MVCCILLMFILAALASLILDAPTIPLLVPVILVTLIFLLLDSPSSVFLTLFLPLSVMQLLSFLLPVPVFPLSFLFFVQTLSFGQSILRFLIQQLHPLLRSRLQHSNSCSFSCSRSCSLFWSPCLPQSAETTSWSTLTCLCSVAVLLSFLTLAQ